MIMLQTNAAFIINVSVSSKKAPDRGGVSPENVLYEGDVPVSEELEDRHLKDFRQSGYWFWLGFLTFHLHRFATEFFCKFCKFCAGLVEPAVTVTANPLSSLGGGVGIVRVHGRIHHLADAAGDQLLLLAVLPRHVLDLGAGVVQGLLWFPRRMEQLTFLHRPPAGSFPRPFLQDVVVLIIKLFKQTVLDWLRFDLMDS